MLQSFIVKGRQNFGPPRAANTLAIRSGVARGESGGTRSGAQALGAQQHTFCSHFKRVFFVLYGKKL